MAKPRAAAPKNPQERLIKAAFESAKLDGWSGLNIAALARGLKLTVAEAYKVAPDRAALLDVYVQGIDARVVEELLAEPAQGPWHDRVFDAIMMRCDAMLKDRDALRVIHFDDRRDPLARAQSARRARRSLERLLQAIETSEDPLALRIVSAALVPVYARAFLVWLNDEDDLARTMAALDKGLRRLEGLWRRLSPERRAPHEPAEAASEDVPPPTDKSIH